MRLASSVVLSLALASAPLLGCGSSGSNPSDAGGGDTIAVTVACATADLTCGAVLPAATLSQLQPSATGYDESAKFPCEFTLPNSSGGVFQAFCGGASLLANQQALTTQSFPGAVTETDTVGSKSFELVVGAPMTLGSIAEVDAVTTNGKYVFSASLSSTAADIAATRRLATAIDQGLSAH